MNPDNELRRPREPRSAFVPEADRLAKIIAEDRRYSRNLWIAFGLFTALATGATYGWRWFTQHFFQP